VSAGHTSTVNPTSHGENLVVRRSRQGQLLLLVIVSGNFAAYVVGWLTGSMTGWFAAVVIALVTVGLLLSVIDFVRSGPRSTPLLRVGPAEVEVGNGATVPWSVLADVRLVRVRWDRQVVAFIPRPGVTVPSIPSPRLGSRRMRGSPAALSARYGTPLVFSPESTAATAQDVFDAAGAMVTNSIAIVRGGETERNIDE